MSLTRTYEEPARCKLCGNLKLVKGSSCCEDCWHLTCACCGRWEDGLRRRSAQSTDSRASASDSLSNDLWECSTCASLPEQAQRRRAQLAVALRRSSFRVWHGWRNQDHARNNPPVTQPARVRDWLRVGDLDDAWALSQGQLAGWGITAVLTLCADRVPEPDREALQAGFAAQGVKWRVIDAQDNWRYDIVRDNLPEAVEFVRPIRDSGGCVLVHCHHGVNRAGAVSVGLLMLLERLPLLQAAGEVIRNRGSVLNNKVFQVQLVRLATEENLLGPEPQEEEAALAPAATWKTRDATRLVRLISVAMRTGLMEAQCDSQGFTLAEWEEWYSLRNPAEQKFMADRAQSVREVFACSRGIPCGSS